ncbi:hypothetical protein D3C81_37320 [compost metagenome]|uniref:MrpH family fimbial adhesin n=1 Tax=Serratia plymuthica TaxID=82996 RepID=UPI000797EA4F|nr:hypothetical protein [Serratia plymuthica]KYG17281.1 hypothetical protein SOD10_17070 [Serratia plymuthica]QQT83976.1 hypothetical protein I6I95_09150 [Serratia plymuthica]
MILFLKRIYYLIFLFSAFSHAEIITDGVYTPNIKLYKFWITSADVNDTTPNPCYKVTTCAMMVAWYDVTGYFNWNTSKYENRYFPWVSSSKTMGEVGSALYKNNKIGFVGISGVLGPIRCQYFGYMLNGGAPSPLPGTTCRPATVDPAQCHIDESNMNIDYGIVHSDRANGLVAQTVIHASCTQDMSIKVIDATGVGSTVNLRPDGSLKAKITINGVPMATGYSFTATPSGTALNIKAELVSSGDVLPGYFNGVAILVISPA